MNTLPLVTVGMPIRNGGELLRAALDSVLAQSYPNLQIIISDNCSADQTAAIVDTYFSRDSRLVYVRQRRPLSIAENFRFVLDRAEGEFFMWAAHDDLRSPDYIEKLVTGLLNDPTALLAFGDLFITGGPSSNVMFKTFDFSTEKLGWVARMRKAAFSQCFHIYGVWRTTELKRIPSPSNAWWQDLPIMLAAAKLGASKYVAGPQFFYYEVPKSNLQRAQSQEYKTHFSLIAAVFSLIVATYSVVSAVGGRFSGVWAACLIIEKQFRGLPGYLGRRFVDFMSRKI
jgi:glycosyltransferase involved in cell wall biosynthesis